MTWTTGANVTTGQVLTAATWNSYMGASGSIMETGTSKITTAGDIVVASGANAVKRLGIGTARQVLGINSAANDVEWQNSAQSVLSAKGSVLSASSANTIGALAVGANGTVLTADSSESLGIKFASGGGTQPTNPFVGSSVMTGNCAGITATTHEYDANEILFFPIHHLEADTTIKGCWGRLNSVTGSSTYTAGVYSSNGTTLTRVAQGSATSLVAGTGKKYSGGLEASCSVGTQYFMAIIFSAATTITMMNPASGTYLNVLGFSGVVSAGSYALPSTQALSGLTLEQFAWNGPVDVNSGYDL